MAKKNELSEIEQAKTMGELRDAVAKLTTEQRQSKPAQRAVFEAARRIVAEADGE